MVNDCTPERSIIKDYTKMSDAQLAVNVSKEYDGAILELARREGRISLYEMPDGTWAATCEQLITDGFANKDAARAWVVQRLRDTGWVEQ